jgi:hypothetical protein
MTLEAQPRRLTPQQAFLNALADVQDAVERHHKLAEQLHKILEPQQAPGDLRYAKLTAATPTNADAASKSKSFTIINPYDFAVNVGIGGIGATNVGAIEVPPNSAMTLPLAGDDLEVGAAVADLAAGDAWVNVIHYRHVQPFFLGAA